MGDTDAIIPIGVSAIHRQKAGLGAAGAAGAGTAADACSSRGDLRYVILSLIADAPRHGYELIKALEERSGGLYVPSPGAVYPILTLLEEQGYTVAATEAGGKKLYTITDEAVRRLRRIGWRSMPSSHAST